MSSLVNSNRLDNIFLITMEAPPVNGLGQPLRAALKEAFEAAAADSGVEAIVLTSACGVFCGGADISEFATGAYKEEPQAGVLLDDLIDRCEKPVVAAINGAALGGGMELALACDYRFAHPKASLGLPEVTLGLLPGGGGTQRLPRITNPKFAIELITSGRPCKPAQALEVGLVDAIFDGQADFVAAAIAYAKQLVADGGVAKSWFDVPVDTSGLEHDFFDQFRQTIARRTKGQIAPESCIQCVEAACALPMKEGLAREWTLFEELAASPQTRAMQYQFFAERQVTRIPGIDPKITPIREIKKVAVIGAGTMGGGIAMNFANIGIPVTLLEMKQEALDRGLGVIRKNYEATAKKGRLTAVQVEECMTLLQGTLDYADLAEADLVIEAVFENMDIKKQVFQTLDDVCKPGAILASNTSTLNVDEIAAATRRPEDVVGLHFFSPANVMRLLEIVRGAKTAPDVLLTVIRTAQQIRKLPVIAGVCWGFVANRICAPYQREMCRLIIEGASPAQIDRALAEFGMGMGATAMADMAGVDVINLAMPVMPGALERDPSFFAIVRKLAGAERFGQKVGKGFYNYEGRTPSESPEVASMAKELAAEFGIAQREISDQEIIERMIYSLIDEGARVLEEGMAYRAGDIDLMYTNGFSFPIWRGGPMHYASEIGLATVLDGLEKYRESLGDHGKTWFQPSALLKQLVAEGKSFNDL